MLDKHTTGPLLVLLAVVLYTQCVQSATVCTGNTACQNGGTCVPLNATDFSCNCTTLFQGSRCENSVCGTCHANATCVAQQTAGYFNCTCALGFTGNGTSCAPCPLGRFTPTTPSDCLPCAPGTYSDVPSRTACTTCDVNTFANTTGLSVCYPCPINTFAPDTQSTHCLPCLPGFTGVNCATNVDDCASTPCQNGGTCTDYADGYNCTCSYRFEGDACEIEKLFSSSAVISGITVQADGPDSDTTLSTAIIAVIVTASVVTVGVAMALIARLYSMRFTPGYEPAMTDAVSTN